MVQRILDVADVGECDLLTEVCIQAEAGTDRFGRPLGNGFANVAMNVCPLSSEAVSGVSREYPT